MKKLLSIFILVLVINVVAAQVSKTLNVLTAGTLSTLLTASEKTTITDITITGNIDACDFKIMRDSMTSLANIDLSGIIIAAYTGTSGTYSTGITFYPANEIPADAFFNHIAFTGKTSLSSIVLPSNVTSIGNNAFGLCRNLKAINIPNNVTSIGYNVFISCTGLTSFTIPSSVLTIDSGVFQNCTGLTTITIPSSVKSIGNYAFQGCSNLTAINVDAYNMYYAVLDGALYNKQYNTLIACPGAKSGSFYIPSLVAAIGDYAFYSCNGLTSIIFPSTVRTIGNNAFINCKSLATITIPSSVTLIGSGSFKNCSKLTEINVESGNLNFSSLNGVLFNKNQSTLIQYPIGKVGSSYSIPVTVSLIGENAFYYCNGLTSVTIPSSITSFGTFAFGYCNGLTSITLPASVTTIGNSAFYSCTGLTSIYANSNVPVNISASSNVFYDVNKTNCTLYVPINSKSLYQATLQWQDFTNVVEKTTAVTTLTNESINIYPNPVIDNFSIVGLEGISYLRVTDLNGKVNIQRQVMGNENVSISELPAGIYMINLFNNGVSYQNKLVKKLGT